VPLAQNVRVDLEHPPRAVAQSLRDLIYRDACAQPLGGAIVPQHVRAFARRCDRPLDEVPVEVHAQLPPGRAREEVVFGPLTCRRSACDFARPVERAAAAEYRTTEETMLRRWGGVPQATTGIPSWVEAVVHTRADADALVADANRDAARGGGVSRRRSVLAGPGGWTRRPVRWGSRASR